MHPHPPSSSPWLPESELILKFDDGIPTGDDARPDMIHPFAFSKFNTEFSFQALKWVSTNSILTSSNGSWMSLWIRKGRIKAKSIFNSSCGSKKKTFPYLDNTALGYFLMIQTQYS